MKIHPVVNHVGGVVGVVLQAQFVGDVTDATDQARIVAYGDPQVNLAGTFSDPLDATFSFSSGTTVANVGITQQMQGIPMQFMVNLPPAQPGKPSPILGPYQVLSPDPVRAAKVWEAAIIGRIQSAMTAFRALEAPLTTIADSTV